MTTKKKTAKPKKKSTTTGRSSSKKKSKSTASRKLAAAPTPTERRQTSRKPYQSPLGLDVQTLEQTFKLIQPNMGDVVHAFYSRLFSRYPKVQPLFKSTNQAEQEKKLVTALNVVMNNLRKPQALVNTLLMLGEKHKGYGALPEHYAAVASTLLEVLQEYTGDVWTQKFHNAWSSALETIAAAMLRAYGTSEDIVLATSEKVVEDQIYGVANVMEDLDVLQDILEYAPINIMVADAHQNVVFVNKRARDVLMEIETELAGYIPGFKVSEVIGGSIHRYHKDPDAVKNILASLGPGESRQGEITPGRFVFEHETRGLHDKSGTLVGYVVQWHDVTEKYKK